MYDFLHFLLILQIVKGKITIFFCIAALLMTGGRAFGQQMSPEEMEKKFYEALENQIERYTTILSLEDWQVFYVDSILTHNMTALRDEINNLNAAKVSSGEYHQIASDKWQEATYNAFHRILTEEQWAKFLKSGAGKEKAARDKRALKRKN